MGIPSVAASEALGVADAIVPGITGELARSGSPADFADAVERAMCLDLSGIDRWLRRFSMQESGLILEHVLLDRLGRRQERTASPSSVT